MDKHRGQDAEEIQESEQEESDYIMPSDWCEGCDCDYFGEGCLGIWV